MPRNISMYDNVPWLNGKQYLKIWGIVLSVIFFALIVLWSLSWSKSPNTIDDKLQELFWIEKTIRQNVCDNEKLREKWKDIANTEKTDRVQLKAILSPEGNAREIFLEENQKFDCK